MTSYIMDDILKPFVKKGLGWPWYGSRF